MLLKGTLVSTCLIVLAPRMASAVQYEVFVDVDSEGELYDLLVTEQQISQSSFNALLLLHQTRVDLNRTSREQLYLLPHFDYGHVDGILAFRERARAIHGLGDLTAAGVLSRQLAKSLRAFVIISDPNAPKTHTNGFVRIEARWSGRYDRLPPASAAQARIKSHRNLDLGVAVALTRNTLGRVRWDPSRNALSSDPERTRFVVPELYVEWEDDNWEIVGGTYRIGFGQRLAFDVTDQATPNGLLGDYELRRGNDLRLRCTRAPGELAGSPCPTNRVAHVTARL